MASVPVSEIIAYEQGELDEEQTIALFQKLVDTRMVWHLQGCYQRVAIALYKAGLITDEDGERYSK